MTRHIIAKYRGEITGKEQAEYRGNVSRETQSRRGTWMPVLTTCAKLVGTVTGAGL
jgi:hypothetical protein